MKPDDDHIFLLLPGDDSPPRPLHPGKLVARTETGCRAAFPDPDLAVDEGMNLLLLYNLQQKFVQQPARIGWLRREEDRVTLELETIGDPGSAESRESYRATAIGSDIRARLGEELCDVLDVSATGFSVSSARRHKPGTSLEAVLYFEGEPLEGAVLVQSVRWYGPKRIRYGLLALDGPDAPATLKAALTRVNLAIQRQRAARLSGNA